MTLNIAGRTIGSQVLQDKIGGSFGSIDKVVQDLKKDADRLLPDVTIANKSAKYLELQHERIKEYSKFIFSEPTPNKENYLKQEELIHPIKKVVPAIIKSNGEETHEEFLTNQVRGILSKRKKSQLAFIANYSRERAFVGTRHGKIYSLETRALQEDISDKSAALTGLARSNDAGMLAWYVIKDLGFVYRKRGKKDLELYRSANERLPHGPFIGAFTYEEDAYAVSSGEGVEREIVHIQSGTSRNTQELQKQAQKLLRRFRYKEREYTYTLDGEVRNVESKQYEYTPEYNETLRTLQNT